MQYLKQIVKAINTQVATKFTDVRFGGAAYHGICTLASNGDKLMPVVCDNYDDDQFITPDDTFPLIIYHRTIQIGYADEPLKSYGNDGNTAKKETAQMALIAYGTRSIIRLTPEELEGAIMSGMPSAIANTTTTQLNLKSCVIRPVNSVLDPVSVYLAEYRTPQYDLGPNALMIRLNYNIESTYKTPCFDLCNC